MSRIIRETTYDLTSPSRAFERDPRKKKAWRDIERAQRPFGTRFHFEREERRAEKKLLSKGEMSIISFLMRERI